MLELIGSAILSPIMEELVFRGIVFGNLRKIMSTGTAIFLSAFLFGIVHFNIVQFIYAFLLGIVLALFMYKSGHMYAAMVGHIAANAFAVLRTECNILTWTMDGSAVAWTLSIILLVAGSIILGYYVKRKIIG